MKKILVIAIVMIASVNFMNAQTNFGIRAGINLGNVTGMDMNESIPGVMSISSTTSMGVGFHVGAVANMEINDNWVFAPEVLYYTVAFKETINISETIFGVSTSQSTSGTGSFSYIQIPLLIQFKLNKEGGLNFSAGPEFGIMMGSSVTSTDATGASTTTSGTSGYNTLNIGVGIGAGYMLDMGLGFDVRYDLGLANVVKAQGTTAAEGKTGVILIGARYMFGMGK
jgi:hypothetical protein